MEKIENITQAYSQAPWRKQLQIIGLFSLFLVFIALVAGIYLNVSAQTASTGRDIQYMKGQIETLDREIEDMQSQIALLLSDHVMEKRAQSMGFQPIEMNQSEYLQVSGYQERQGVVLAPYTRQEVVKAPTIPEEYTQPLVDWIKVQLNWISISLPEIVP